MRDLEACLILNRLFAIFYSYVDTVTMISQQGYYKTKVSILQTNIGIFEISLKSGNIFIIITFNVVLSSLKAGKIFKI